VHRSSLPLRLLIPALLLGLALASGVWWFTRSRVTELRRPAPPGAMTMHDPGHLSGDVWSQPATCARCHAEAFSKWHGTNHALANRPFDAEKDRATLPARMPFTPGAERIEVFWKGSGAQAFSGDGKRLAPRGPAVGIIGVEPLRQLLIDAGGGRFQVTPMAWDPAKREWFDVFRDDPRRPGDWGHWLGQGMNWNSNCAACHMTDYQKGFDLATGDYASRWGLQGISCVQCHRGAADHARRADRGEVGTFTRAAPGPAQENCLSCHSRREDLTGNFVSGDRFHDHYRLSLPDEPGLYFADGQILDEVFEAGSHHLGAMGGRSGIRCADCHDPHTLAPILPVENDALCMRCHTTGLQNAPVIVPANHTLHAPGSAGSRCISCHMPTRTYMARDPRHDHSFPIPDPRLTKELGVPNACTSCHADKPLEWLIETAERFWGPGMNAARRPRARAVAAAQRGEASSNTLLDLLAEDQPDGWRATLASFLRQTAPTERAVHTLEKLAVEDPDATVRGRAVEVLTGWGRIESLKDRVAADPARVVRLAATTRPETVGLLPSTIREELRHYLSFNADRPGHRPRAAELAIREGDPATARAALGAAAALAPNDAGLLHDLAILHSRLGDLEPALANLRKAAEQAPANASIQHSLGLVLAENQDLSGAVAAFEAAVRIDPAAGRSWYNLSVARLQRGEREQAATALGEARKLRGASPQELAAMEQALRR